MIIKITKQGDKWVCLDKTFKTSTCQGFKNKDFYDYTDIICNTKEEVFDIVAENGCGIDDRNNLFAFENNFYNIPD